MQICHNKKGNILAIAIIFIILFLIMFLGVIVAIGSSILNWTFDTIMPELTTIGMMGTSNASKISESVINPIDTAVQSFTWISGVLYVMVLIGSLGFAVMMRSSPNRWLIGFYLLLMIMLIMGAIFVSNMYEDFYDDSDDLGTRLKQHTIMSYMILYSPAVFTIIGFITGIILFSGVSEEDYL